MSTTGGSNLVSGQPGQNPTASTAALSNDDPEKLLNEWLGELKTIIGVSLKDPVTLTKTQKLPLIKMKLNSNVTSNSPF